VGNFFTNEHWYYSDLELEDNKYCDNGDLLYAWSASFGPRIWGGDKVIYHYHIWKVVPNPAVIDKMFLFYLLEWDVDKIKRDHGTGATMIHVSKKSMESRVLPYFDLDSQKEIVLRLQAMKNHTNSLKRQYDDKLRAIVSYKESILRKAFSGELVKE
jgi:type I restriction enzyme S subunit